MESENIIMAYISAWNWHILAVIFLVSSLIVVFSGESLGNNILFAVFLLGFACCETMALYRKVKLNPEEEHVVEEITYDSAE